MYGEAEEMGDIWMADGGYLDGSFMGGGRYGGYLDGSFMGRRRIWVIFGWQFYGGTEDMGEIWVASPVTVLTGFSVAYWLSSWLPLVDLWP